MSSLLDDKQDLHVEIQSLKEQLRIAEEKLLQREKLSNIGELAAGMAHEIRNPLTPLDGFLQIIKSESNSERVKSYINIMESEIKKIDIITKEMMNLAKPSKLKFTSVSLQKVVNDSIALLSHKSFKYDVVIKNLVNERDFHIYADETMVKQVFINLIKNGIESMKNSGGVLTIDFIVETNGYVTVVFKDNGCGIPQIVLDRLGEPFFTTKEDGNGLGLMICYKIIRKHKGQVSIESEIGKGTKFLVKLPLI